MDLISFAREYMPYKKVITRGITEEAGIPPQILPLFPDRKSAEAFLSTTWWQVVMRSQEFYNRLRQFGGIRRGNFHRLETMIVDPGEQEGLHNMIILDPNYEREAPRKIPKVQLNEFAFRRSWQRWKFETELYLSDQDEYAEESRLSLGTYRKLLDILEPADIYRYGAEKNFEILLARQPKVETTACQTGLFHQPIGVAPVPGGNPTSTAGVWVEDRNGRKGVTTCLHAIAHSIGQHNIHVGKTQVEINGVLGTIQSFDLISDSCFVEIDLAEAFNTASVLCGKSPRNETGRFSGLKSGVDRDAYIQGWTPDVPFCQPLLQLRVYTSAVTNPGDSGCALLDSEGNIIGFSFYRTRINQQPSYSCWIWAESVFQFHNLI